MNWTCEYINVNIKPAKRKRNGTILWYNCILIYLYHTLITMIIRRCIVIFSNAFGGSCYFLLFCISLFWSEDCKIKVVLKMQISEPQREGKKQKKKQKAGRWKTHLLKPYNPKTIQTRMKTLWKWNPETAALACGFCNFHRFFVC